MVLTSFSLGSDLSSLKTGAEFSSIVELPSESWYSILFEVTCTIFDL